MRGIAVFAAARKAYREGDGGPLPDPAHYRVN